MKKILAMGCMIFLTGSAFSQIRLCEENAVMYSICYQLDTNGTFTYAFRHCTGIVSGQGKYSHQKNSLVFHFDTLLSPQVYRYHVPEMAGKVRISYTPLGTPSIPANCLVRYAGINTVLQEDGSVTINYAGGPVIIIQRNIYSDSIVINPGEEAYNHYDIRWLSPADSYTEAGKTVTMKKTGKRYRYRDTVLVYSENKKYGYPQWKTKWKTTYYTERQDRSLTEK